MSELLMREARHDLYNDIKSKQGIIMKKVSLLNVSLFVVTAAVASSVNAGDKVKVEKKADTVIAANELFEPLDTDKNGVISEKELGDNQNALLKKEFKKIDANADKGISEEELKQYLAKVDVKIDI
ncbi:hypothetical protein ACFSJY_02205 [Thalassotalea euphylliae]|uniref:hypothetical protein n=1 Tax=Thalassotalea euphylliae TaxID=1655234 RepID=UPI00362CA03E